MTTAVMHFGAAAAAVCEQIALRGGVFFCAQPCSCGHFSLHALSAAV